jgi:SAM-dependent methyltransferase
MKKVYIKEKLESMDVPVDSVVMGDFDYIGEFTAKRHRAPSDENYKKYGSFYRSNYERGILIYHLIRRYNLTSMLEIGFGRGYSTFCAARAFYDSGVKGTIVTIDPNIDEAFLNSLGQVFPKEWFEQIKFLRGNSSQALDTVVDQFDLVYIDGDHSYEATKTDWEKTRKNASKFTLLDDYHLSTKQDKGTIECSRAIDEFDFSSYDEPELIIGDRRMFFDDRQFPDSAIDYGQVLVAKKGFLVENEW